MAKSGNKTWKCQFRDCAILDCYSYRTVPELIVGNADIRTRSSRSVGGGVRWLFLFRRGIAGVSRVAMDRYNDNLLINF